VGTFYRGCLAFVFIAAGLIAKDDSVALVKPILKQDSLKFIADDWKTEVSDIEQEIEKLKNQRNLYLAKAVRLQNQGDRLQFEQNNLIDARRAWQQAQIHREIATRIQEEIDALEKRKTQILETHGMKSEPKKESSNSNK
jgi:hypothetical protein